MNKTTFTRNPETGVWSWTTRSHPNQEITGDAGGYNDDGSALNGYFSQQGFPDWQPGDTLPEGYRFAEDSPGGDKFTVIQETT